MKSLNNVKDEIDTEKISEYITSCDWKCKKSDWEKYIYDVKSFGIDCVYIISLNFEEDKLEKWKSEIRQNLIP